MPSITSTVQAPTSPSIHDTCEECGYDGDIAVIRDLEQGLVGWECPDCYTFIVMRDLDDER